LKSIVKNIFTTIVALTLLIGSSGIQLYKHTCNAHDFSAVSLIETPKCETDHQVGEKLDECCRADVDEIIEQSCCEFEPIDELDPVSITSQEIKCCITSIESSQLKDILFTSTEKKNLTLELFTALVPFIEKNIQQTAQNLIIRNNDLPPPKFGKQLLQTIHQLKIDIPIC
jgi:hypothetical protein